MIRRLQAGTVVRFLEIAGVRMLTNESSSAEVFEAVFDLAMISHGLTDGDNARVYAATLDWLDAIRQPEPDTMESLFLDRMYREVAIYGSFTEDQGSFVREEGGSVAPGEAGAGGLLEERERDTAGEQRGRARQVISVALGDPDQAWREPEPVERDERGRGSILDIRIAGSDRAPERR